MKRISVLFALFTAFAVPLPTAQAQGNDYLVGDKVYVGYTFEADIDLSTVQITTAPSEGSIVVDGSGVKYLPNAGAIGVDVFEFTASTDTGLNVGFFGTVLAGDVDVQFEATFSDGTDSFEVDAEIEIDSVSNSILGAGLGGTAIATTTNGFFATITEGTFAQNNFASTSMAIMSPDLKSFFEWLAPGSAVNNWNVAVLIWSDDTGYYYLPPGETSPSGDTVDYIFIGGVWTKVSLLNGCSTVQIDTTGVVKESCGHYTTPSYPGLPPQYVPPATLPPVPPGDWIPTDSDPIVRPVPGPPTSP